MDRGLTLEERIAKSQRSILASFERYMGPNAPIPSSKKSVSPGVAEEDGEIGVQRKQDTPPPPPPPEDVPKEMVDDLQDVPSHTYTEVVHDPLSLPPDHAVRQHLLFPSTNSASLAATNAKRSITWPSTDNPWTQRTFVSFKSSLLGRELFYSPLTAKDWALIEEESGGEKTASYRVNGHRIGQPEIGDPVDPRLDQDSNAKYLSKCPVNAIDNMKYRDSSAADSTAPAFMLIVGLAADVAQEVVQRRVSPYGRILSVLLFRRGVHGPAVSEEDTKDVIASVCMGSISERNAALKADNPMFGLPAAPTSEVQVLEDPYGLRFRAAFLYCVHEGITGLDLSSKSWENVMNGQSATTRTGDPNLNQEGVPSFRALFDAVNAQGGLGEPESMFERPSAIGVSSGLEDLQIEEYGGHEGWGVSIGTPLVAGGTPVQIQQSSTKLNATPQRSNYASPKHDPHPHKSQQPSFSEGEVYDLILNNVSVDCSKRMVIELFEGFHYDEIVRLGKDVRKKWHVVFTSKYERDRALDHISSKRFEGERIDAGAWDRWRPNVNVRGVDNRRLLAVAAEKPNEPPKPVRKPLDIKQLKRGASLYVIEKLVSAAGRDIRRRLIDQAIKHTLPALDEIRREKAKQNATKQRQIMELSPGPIPISAPMDVKNMDVVEIGETRDDGVESSKFDISALPSFKIKRTHPEPPSRAPSKLTSVLVEEPPAPEPKPDMSLVRAREKEAERFATEQRRREQEAIESQKPSIDLVDISEESDASEETLEQLRKEIELRRKVDGDADSDSDGFIVGDRKRLRRDSSENSFIVSDDDDEDMLLARELDKEERQRFRARKSQQDEFNSDSDFGVEVGIPMIKPKKRQTNMKRSARRRIDREEYAKEEDYRLVVKTLTSRGVSRETAEDLIDSKSYRNINPSGCSRSETYMRFRRLKMEMEAEAWREQEMARQRAVGSAIGTTALDYDNVALIGAAQPGARASGILTGPSIGTAKTSPTAAAAGVGYGYATLADRRIAPRDRELRAELQKTRRLFKQATDVGAAAAPEVEQLLALRARRKQLVFRPSLIHHWGLFADENIAENDLVIEYVGEIVRSKVSDVREQHYERMGIGSSYLFRIDAESVVDATMKGNIARFMNHSCDPNCFAKIVKVVGQDRIIVYALRDIKTGEEITYDYKFPPEETNRIPCRCGAAKCRGFLN